ncbi:putative dehydrogenase [Kribbella amoyensis]|uniref:Putative dehydrogenase n=1 Tax=Kribbella amoyensis TaxID=996641 RepID=A0A561BVM1_9ACTN|nr:Gfo/Idh/MocA family oxidoreductase [Kribbella amoyensis]TWD82920.1 putative dehydrogenase [Kribbella amoyensis]
MTKIGIVGTGVISGTYLDHLGKLPGVEVVAVADLDVSRAQAVADNHPGVRALSSDDLLADPAVDIVLNLTIPAAHAPVHEAALRAGKHVYGEKPLAVDRAEAEPLLKLAAANDLRIGCAPDTVLGTGTQTARAAIDRGDIGVPTAATASFVTPGHELWHPAPEFYYQAGGGPLLDMGPYYVTSLVTLLGPVRRVTGRAGRAHQERKVHKGPRAGTVFGVDVPTHVTGILEHESGALTTVLMSFDIWAARLPRIEVHGTEGSLSVPDPNAFDGKVELATATQRDWTELPVAGGYAGAGRGVGVADMARAIRTGGKHRADGALAYHVLDIMESLLESAAQDQSLDVASTVDRPAAVPLGASPDLA